MFLMSVWTAVFLGGMLSSVMSMLFAARFLNMIMGGGLSAGLFAIELYGGLVMFMLYIVFDTQVRSSTHVRGFPP